MKEKNLLMALLLMFTFSLANVIAQNDTMYIMKKGEICGKHNVNDVDSVIFYQPNVTPALINIEWVDIPAGTFMMGSPLTEPERAKHEVEHQVTLSAFKMSKYEVTFDQYDVFCEATGRKKPDDKGWGRGNHPVINVTWDDATAFCLWLSQKGGKTYRLPTESEWEYACRAGKTTPFNTGDCISTSDVNYDGTDPYSNCEKGEFRDKPLPVGSFSPNAWGLYDMHGNMWEWCNDWYGDYPTTPQTDPQGAISGSKRVMRGGGWGAHGKCCRSAYRSNGRPVFYADYIGFRVVYTK